MKLVRTNALLPIPTSPETDTFGMEGYPVMLNSDRTVDLCQDSQGSPPFGIVVLGAKHPGKVTVAIAAGGVAGTVRVRLVQAVPYAGTLLQLADAPGVVGFGPDTGSGLRLVMAQAMESGVANELIEAVLFKPITYTS